MILSRFFRWRSKDKEGAAASGGSGSSDLEGVAFPDGSSAEKRAALGLPKDEKRLTEMALNKSNLCVAAVGGLTDARLLARVAVEAESPDARAAAACRLEDPVLLQKISTQDPNAMVRKCARSKLSGPESLRDFLKVSLATLEIAELKAANAASTFSDFDGICDALTRDQRFRINGVIGEIDGPANRATVATAAKSAQYAVGEKNGGASGRSTIDLVAVKHVGEGEPAEGGSRIPWYHIRIARTGENAFCFSAEEPRS